MTIVKLPSDRVINSTDTNEYAEGFRDETLVDDSLVDVEIPLSDEIPEAINENQEGERPIYNEEGYRRDRGN